MTDRLTRQRRRAADPGSGCALGDRSCLPFHIPRPTSWSFLENALGLEHALHASRADLHVGLSSLKWTVNALRDRMCAGPPIITAPALGDRFRAAARMFIIGGGDGGPSTMGQRPGAMAPDAGRCLISVGPRPFRDSEERS